MEDQQINVVKVDIEEYDKERNSFRQGRVHVVDGKCSTCIFRPGNLMDLSPGRVRGLVEDAIDAGTAITCHKTLIDDRDNALCGGFYDAYSDQVPVLQIAKRLNIIEKVEPWQ